MDNVPPSPLSVTMGAVNRDTKVETCTPAFTQVPASTSMSYSDDLTAPFPNSLGDPFGFWPDSHLQQPESAYVTLAQVDSSCIPSSPKASTSSLGPISPSVTKKRRDNGEKEKDRRDRNKRSAAASRKRKKGKCNDTDSPDYIHGTNIAKRPCYSTRGRNR
jgi:hypothetical protein